MDVAPVFGDPMVEDAANMVIPARGVSMRRVGIIAAPPGFGKTSLLAAAAELAARQLAGRTLWINGSVVASEQHLTRLLSPLLTLTGDGAAAPGLAAQKDSAADPLLIAVDDIDALVFKRAKIVELITRLLVSNHKVRLLASCHPAAAERFLSSRGWLFALSAATLAPIPVVSIDPLDDERAMALIRHREPGLSEAATRAIAAAAGGHPAALVFLSRLAVLLPGKQARPHLRRDSASNDRRTDIQLNKAEASTIIELVNWSAEFAGAVYAEAWAALGPQQRAILWQLARGETPVSASDVAAAIALPASHVSAQLTRLTDDGLVRRTGVRGQFVVARLLSRWIARRAARDELRVPCNLSRRSANEYGSRFGRSVANDKDSTRPSLTSHSAPHPGSSRLMLAKPRGGQK